MSNMNTERKIAEGEGNAVDDKQESLANIIGHMTFGPIPRHTNDIELLRMFAIRIYRAAERERMARNLLVMRIFDEDICPKCEKRENCVVNSKPYESGVFQCKAIPKFLEYDRDSQCVAPDELLSFAAGEDKGSKQEAEERKKELEWRLKGV